MSDTRPDFADVCEAEGGEIARRRRALNIPADAGRVGLALSGGGIRSATFSLGVLQALSSHGLLRLADYLSTVSGGGFIGGCVSALLNDPAANADTGFPLRARTGAPDTASVLHVRNSENYLAPGGFTDRMRIPALLLRGIILNLLFLCPYLLLAVSLTEALVYWNAGEARLPIFALLPAVAPAIFLLLVITYPMVSRRVRRAAWDIRNRYEAAMAFWFIATLISVLMWPFFALVDGAIHLTPTDLLEMAQRAVSMTLSLTTLVLVLSGAIACALVPRIAALARRLVLLLAAATPLLVVGAYLVLCVMLINPPETGPANGWAVFGVAVAWFLLNVFIVNVNLTSAHGFYRDRLSRAYFLEGQKLSGLNSEDTTGPYHLINVALDLNGTTDVNVRGRNCDFFFFSKLFTGGQRTGYCRTEDMEKADPHVDLGTAVAVSGAAASPNAGVTTVKQLTALMSLLNVRLDYWLPNPAFVTAGSGGLLYRIRHRLGPGPSYLWREALGQVDSRGQFINISDGGHIENLAVYELLRRRCRLIIAVDGEQDADMHFDGLMKLVLYARIDLGVTIDVDLTQLRLNAARVSEAHCVAARIDYGGGEEGMLLYLKSSMTGDEDENMRDYRRTHPQFPHEPTSDQFFDERQFEMYRALGFHIGECAVAQLTSSLAPAGFAKIRDILAVELAWGRSTYA
jgi:predicted acylesterase/phospholipase RssA